jgi:arylsulfatase A-like enzyme
LAVFRVNPDAILLMLSLDSGFMRTIKFLPASAASNLILLLSSFIATALLTFDAAAAPQTRPPNFLVIITDDQRPDTIGALGNPAIRTPHLDTLVRSGTAFTRAITAYPICFASRGEILTGATCFRNGVPYGGGKLKPEMVFWGDALRAAGYHTWYVGKWHNDGHPHQRGYEETRGLYSSGGAGKREPQFGRKDREITGYRGWTFKTDDGRVELEKGVGLTADISQHFADAAIELLDRQPEKPFFLHLNFTAPHDPLILPPGYENAYNPVQMPLPRNFQPEHPFDHGNFHGRDEQLLPWPRTPEDIREELAAYYAVISHMDEQIGRVLAALKANGQAENTIIVFSSDHGLALGSHGLMGKQNMYEHSIGVPFIISGPGIQKNRRVAAQCYLRDLFPTTCELAGIPIPPTVQARSLVPVLTGKTDSIYPHLFGYFTDTQRMIRTDRWKLVYYPKLERYQLFDLRADPDELSDLAGHAQHAKTESDLRQKIAAWFKAQGDPVFAATP